MNSCSRVPRPAPTTNPSCDRWSGMAVATLSLEGFILRSIFCPRTEGSRGDQPARPHQTTVGPRARAIRSDTAHTGGVSDGTTTDDGLLRQSASTAPEGWDGEATEYRAGLC